MQRMLISAMSALTGGLFVGPASFASPFVYTTGGLLSTDLKTCLAQARTAASQAGFTQDQEDVLDDDKKDATFFAVAPDAPLTVTVRCFPTAGVFSLAVGGINNDVSFERFKSFVDAFYKD